MDARCAPLRVLAAHPSDQITQAPIDLGPPCSPPRFPTPERREARTMPAKDGLRLNDLCRTQQARPKPGHPDQQGTVRRGGARLKAMLSWWRRNRFSASSRRGDLKKSMTNIVSECRSANIVRDHAMILPDDATPKPDGIFGKDR